MTENATGPAHSTEWAGQSIQGVGLGLRGPHITEILQRKPDVPWFEVLADNHTAQGGLIPAQLAAIRADYPLTFHCVSMSLAGTDPMDMVYLSMIKKLASDIEPTWISDHLCFTQFGGHHHHDLLPVPYTEESLKQISARIDLVQNFLGQQILVENVSSYLEFEESDLGEAEFIAELLKSTDCGLLLDLNNVYVSSQNHQFNAMDYLDLIPLDRVKEIHLAGFDDRGDYLLDAHNNPVSESVWSLYRHVIAKIPDVATLIEWDNDLPEFAILLDEVDRANVVAKETQQGKE